jgi:hypothetical protein
MPQDEFNTIWIQTMFTKLNAKYNGMFSFYFFEVTFLLPYVAFMTCK